MARSWLLLVFCFGVLAGCATPSRPEGMVASVAQSLHRSAASIAIEVTGGRPTEAVRTPQISNEDFALAIQRSIEQSGLFARVTPGAGEYRLVTYIGRLDHPLLGGAVRVDMEVDFQLLAAADGKPVWRRSIRSQHTVTTAEAFSFVERVRMGNEVAARRNIEQMLNEIAALKLR